jgi:hypothetical protein
MDDTAKLDSKIAKRKSPTKQKQENSTSQLGSNEEVIKLKKRISQLEAQNKSLRHQITTLTANANRPTQSYRDTVREQQHNFFKYSNIRRY